LVNSLERLLQICGKVSATAESALQVCDKVSATAESALQVCDRVSATAESALQVCGRVFSYCVSLFLMFYVAKQLFKGLPFRVLMNTFTRKTRNYQQIKNKNHEPATQKTFFCTPEGVNFPCLFYNATFFCVTSSESCNNKL
jgi:hypothetical protein